MTTPSELNRRTVLKTVGAGVVGSVALTGNATAQQGRLKKELAEVRSATAEYNDPANAYADGYFARDHDGNVPLEDVVDEAHAVCGMGFHFVNPDLVGSTEPTEPAVLAYGVDDEDDLILGAVEYIVPQNGPSEEEPPDIFAHDDGMEKWQEDSPKEGQSSLHVWVHNPNPAGVFAPFNPRKQFHPSECDGHEH